MPEPTRVEKALTAVNEASISARNVWITFLLFGTYLAITVGATTHTQLLLAEPVKLPIFDVQLDLFSFYWVAPGLLLIFHLYLLVQLDILASRLHGLGHASIQRHLPRGTMEDISPELWRQVHSFIFTQSMAGRGEGFIRWLSKHLIVVSTVVIAPVVLLFAFQIRFLPYHSIAITWWHRVVLIVDIASLMIFWRAWWHQPAMPLVRSGIVAIGVMVAALSIWVATFPGEWVSYEVTRPLTEWFFQGSVRESSRSVNSWFSRNLVLPELDLVADKEAKSPEVTHTLRGRDLSDAILYRIDLHNADFSASDLGRAILHGAKLMNARFTCLDEGSELECTNLSGADLRGADLRGADLGDADLGGADLQGADLQRANLQGANLQGANLQQADLRDASLKRADVRGATFRGADLQDADLSGSDLRFADLAYASLTPISKSLKLGAHTHPLSDSAYWPELAEHLGSLACESNRCVALGIARRVVGTAREDGAKHGARAFACRLLHRECKGGSDLTEDDRAWLQSSAGAEQCRGITN